MARIRTIKPEFWSSPSMAGLNPWGRLLFIALWNWADDTGRGTANPKELAGFAFPNDDEIGAAELPTLLAEIRGRFGVVFYEVAGRRYYAIPTWEKHQRNERRAKSRYPAPEDGIEYDPGPQSPPDQPKSEAPQFVTEVPAEIVGTSDAAHGSSGPGTGEQGNRGIPPTAGADSTATDSGETESPALTLVPDTDLGQPTGPEAAPQPVSAQTILGEYIDHCPKRPPKDVLGQLAKHIKAMLAEGIDPDDVRRGMAAWHAKGLHPRTLSSVVNEVMNRPANPPPDQRPSTTDQRVAAALELARKYAAEEAEAQDRQLPGGAA
jgi:hypothetical protein